jgi:hypothetical protein
MDIQDLSKRYCRFCEQRLTIIGHNRKNGKDNCFDWQDRDIHKKCLKEESERFARLYKCGKYKNSDNSESEEEI